MKRAKPMRWTIALALCAAVTAQSASTSELCPATAHLANLARENFAIQPQPADVRKLAFGLSGSNGPAECRIVVKPDKKSHMCMWAFDYRDFRAATGLEDLTTAIETCLGAIRSQRQDNPVNHPDSYEARYFKLDGVNISASIKDKAALEKTFVFLWVEGDQSP